MEIEIKDKIYQLIDNTKNNELLNLSESDKNELIFSYIESFEKENLLENIFVKNKYIKLFLNNN